MADKLPVGSANAPLFNAVVKAVTFATGWSPADFDFTPGKIPMSTLKETATAMAIYYVVIFGGRELMRSRPAFRFDALFKLHNFGLTALSGALLVLFLEQIIPTLWNGGVYHAVCHRAGGWTQPLVMLYYLNYLTKYVEFIDTCFLFLRKKPLSFLHTYHHGATALLCFLQLSGGTPVSWVPIVLNLGVHCLMYYYYFQSARGIKIWWKQYITQLQIIQFVIDLGFVYFTSYNLLVNKYAPQLPHYGTCDGTVSAAFSGAAILTSYLFLFIAFYFATYKKGGKSAGKAEKAEKDVGVVHKVSNGKDSSALGALKRVNVNLARKGEAALPIVSQRD